MTYYKKLVRDNIPEFLKSKNISHTTTIATNSEMKAALIKKLQEETEEFIENPTCEELADIQEVMDSLKQFPEYSNLDTVQEQKRKTKGGFNKRYIVEGHK